MITLTVCASNGMTFQNRERFNCAVDCGDRIQITREGRCPRPTQSSVLFQ